ncbi:MAG: hypothetical protein HXY34_01060 [Candidatus Thorarchaeota archaeon]|nr:hypothetical protein [Candidatus Thorarchaeota archaeon]
MLAKNAIEGALIVTHDGLIFHIKGVVQPENRIVAYLRYLPDERGDRRSLTGVRYVKISSLEGAERVVKEMYPQYIWKDPRQGREMQAVPMESIAYILDPVDALNSMRSEGPYLRGIRRDALDLAEKLVEAAGIEREHMGITGSQLAGLENERSDIDLVVYGEKAARKLYATMKGEARVKGVHRYAGKRLINHVLYRWGTLESLFERMRELEERKCLQGVFRNRDFFIRAVKKDGEQNRRYDSTVVRYEGQTKAMCRVIEDKDSIFTPCEYIVTCKEIPDLKLVASYRGRFTEHAVKGERILVEGRLESVECMDSGEVFKQIVLGDRVTDYMVPIK